MRALALSPIFLFAMAGVAFEGMARVDAPPRPVLIHAAMQDGGDDCESIEDRDDQKDCFRAQNARALRQAQQDFYQNQQQQRDRIQELMAADRERRANGSQSASGNDAPQCRSRELRCPSNDDACIARYAGLPLCPN